MNGLWPAAGMKFPVVWHQPFMPINATLAQLEAFVDFYGIKEGDGMYIAQKDKEVWLFPGETRITH